MQLIFFFFFFEFSDPKKLEIDNNQLISTGQFGKKHVEACHDKKHWHHQEPTKRIVFFSLQKAIKIN
jgi:hypothetical protein